MSDGLDPISQPPAVPNAEQVEIMRRRASALTGQERTELLADIEAMLSRIEGPVPGNDGSA